MEKTLKRQIVDAAEAVKRKIRKMREVEIDNKQALETVFKPVTESLNQIATASKRASSLNGIEDEETEVPFVEQSLQKEKTNRTVREKDDEHETDSDCSYQSLAESSNNDVNMSSWSVSSEALADIPFGVRVERGKLMLGSAAITINDEYIMVAGRKYRNTSGLKELLLRKDIDLSLVTESDMLHYKSMLLDTNAHRRDNDPSKPIKSNKGQKYLQVIKPLFKLQSTVQTSQSKGKGLHLTKIWKKDVDFIYWDNPNELVDRLKLLIASRDAGNTGVDNEIISIIKELRESNIINK